MLKNDRIFPLISGIFFSENSRPRRILHIFGMSPLLAANLLVENHEKHPVRKRLRKEKSSFRTKMRSTEISHRILILFSDLRKTLVLKKIRG